MGKDKKKNQKKPATPATAENQLPVEVNTN